MSADLPDDVARRLGARAVRDGGDAEKLGVWGNKLLQQRNGWVQPTADDFASLREIADPDLRVLLDAMQRGGSLPQHQPRPASEQPQRVVH